MKWKKLWRDCAILIPTAWAASRFCNFMFWKMLQQRRCNYCRELFKTSGSLRKDFVGFAEAKSVIEQLLEHIERKTLHVAQFVFSPGIGGGGKVFTFACPFSILRPGMVGFSSCGTSCSCASRKAVDKMRKTTVGSCNNSFFNVKPSTDGSRDSYFDLQNQCIFAPGTERNRISRSPLSLYFGTA